MAQTQVHPTPNGQNTAPSSGAGPRSATDATHAAFFDVDETLITIKSMFSFLRFYLHSRGQSEGTYDRLRGELSAAAQAGVPREEINRSYYRLYVGESARTLADIGRRWFQEAIAPSTFIPTTLTLLRDYRKQGVPYGLVSGSFFACLDPIAEHLAADWTNGSEPIIRRGKLTGEITAPMIGLGKAAALQARAAAHGLDLEHCTAYADDVSDLAMLEAVGHPVVVGNDPTLTAHARRHGWPQLHLGP